MNDPRGPVRQIVAIEERTDATLLKLSCGHVGRFNQIFHYKLGHDCHCVQCSDGFTSETERAEYIASLVNGLEELS